MLNNETVQVDSSRSYDTFMFTIVVQKIQRKCILGSLLKVEVRKWVDNLMLKFYNFVFMNNYYHMKSGYNNK